MLAEEHGKTLAEARLRLPNAGERVEVKVNSKLEPALRLCVQVDGDGNYAFNLLARQRQDSAVVCRYDRAEHKHLPLLDTDTGLPIRAGHKHYNGERVEPPERIVDRESEIPSLDLQAGLVAFCEELNIVPPEMLPSSFTSVLSETDHE
jgi:hypothetical protein